MRQCSSHLFVAVNIYLLFTRGGLILILVALLASLGIGRFSFHVSTFIVNIVSFLRVGRPFRLSFSR